MRTIKFRFWDGKKYHYPEATKEEANHYLQFGSKDWWLFNSDGKMVTSSEEGGVCEQYVGKIGANKCEVWEGDKVIARLNHHGKPTELKIPAFIAYNEHVGIWQINYENHAGHIVSDDIGFRYFLEVIGNIHE